MDAKNSTKPVFDFIVVGGGIAAVSCVEYLAYLKQEANICIISSSDLIKAVSNVRKVTQNLEEFDVVEKPLSTLSTECCNVTVVRSTVVAFDPSVHKVITSLNEEYYYRKLCICCGARPNLIAPENQHVLGLRDLQSVEYFQNRLSTASRVVVIGNGGIALELAYELRGCQIIWAIKDDSIGNAYLDKGAAQFLLPNLKQDSDTVDKITSSGKTENCSFTDQQDYKTGKDEYACALGPGWKERMNRKDLESNVQLELNCFVAAVLTPEEYKDFTKHCTTYPEENREWKVYIKLTNEKIFGCDFVVSATGVVPNIEPFVKCAAFNVASDGGLKVDDHMRTNICDVYAAGDVCSTSWAHSEHWMQMRIWSQAKQMGAYAARCMVADLDRERITMDFCFELFAHVTRFFGYKVILLGKFNGQGLHNDYQVLLRCTTGKEYVKVVVHEGRIHGALLIGDTDLEETFENLILNQLDISAFGEHLLDPNIDIEDYFD